MIIEFLMSYKLVLPTTDIKMKFHFVSNSVRKSGSSSCMDAKRHSRFHTQDRLINRTRAGINIYFFLTSTEKNKKAMRTEMEISGTSDK